MDPTGHALNNMIKGIKIEVHSNKGVHHISHGDTGGHEGSSPVAHDDMEAKADNQDEEKNESMDEKKKEEMDLAPDLEDGDKHEHGMLDKMHKGMSGSKLGNMAKDKMKERMASIESKKKPY